MKIVLTKEPKNPIIVEGFPGFGLVGSISTEFLVNNLKTEQIGSIKIEEVSPMIAIHSGEVVEPIGIYYDKRFNLVIVHAITNVQGMEWEIKKNLLELAERLKAKEIICIEGILGSGESEPRSFYFTNSSSSDKKFTDSKIPKLSEGIVVGVTGALLLEKNPPVSSIFVETHSAMPDSKAAAKVIEVIDKYLKLDIDYVPLLKQAEVFEKKLKKFMQQKSELAGEQDKKKMSYIS